MSPDETSRICHQVGACKCTGSLLCIAFKGQTNILIVILVATNTEDCATGAWCFRRLDNAMSVSVVSCAFVTSA